MEGGEGQRPLVDIEESLCRITRNLLFLCTSCSVTDTLCVIKTFVAPELKTKTACFLFFTYSFAC